MSSAYDSMTTGIRVGAAMGFRLSGSDGCESVVVPPAPPSRQVDNDQASGSSFPAAAFTGDEHAGGVGSRAIADIRKPGGGVPAKPLAEIASSLPTAAP